MKKKKVYLLNLIKKIIKVKIKNAKISRKDRSSLEKIGTLKLEDNEIEINYKLNEISMKSIIEILYQTNLDIIDLSTKEVNLEDVFINLTSNK